MPKKYCDGQRQAHNRECALIDRFNGSHHQLHLHSERPECRSIEQKRVSEERTGLDTLLKGRVD